MLAGAGAAAALCVAIGILIGVEEPSLALEQRQ